MVFGCISKNFPENIFWCLEKKKENTNPEKHKPQPRKKSSTTTGDHDRRRDCDPRSRSTERSRSREEGEIAITISDRDRRCGRRTVFSVVVDDFFSGLWLVFFWICVFLLLFQTPESIFRKIF